MKKLYILVTVIFASAFMFAQNGSLGMVDAHATGFGKTYTANSRGVYAIGINPANLALPGGKRFEIAPPLNIAMRAGTDFLSIDEFNYFFGGVDSAGTKVGRYLTDDDKERLVNLFKDGGTFITDLSLIQFGASAKFDSSIGAFGFSIQDVFYTKFKFPSGIIELAMNGNRVGTDYDLNDMQFKSTLYRTYNFAYAREVKILPKWFRKATLGIGIKYIAGYAYASLDKINTSITTDSNFYIGVTSAHRVLTAFSESFGVNYDFDSSGVKKKSAMSAFPEAAGSGMGYDIGFSAIINDKWSIALAVTDIGSINWNKNAAEYISESSMIIKDASDPNLSDSLKNQFKDKGKYLSSFTTKLPTTLRLGASYIFRPDVFMLTADWNFGLNDAPRNEKVGRFSFGGEWNAARWLPYLRGGVSFGGADFFSWTVGLGLNIWRIELNAATPDFQYLFSPKSGKRVSFAAGWRFRFN